MYEVTDKNRRIFFTDKTDADNYTDFINNGLKVIRIQGRTHYFNNGDRLIDTSYRDTKSYVLITHTGRRITSINLMKKHLTVI
nr:MAG TPA: hypothetical protein [Caudoviricetes sp.]